MSWLDVHRRKLNISGSTIKESHQRANANFVNTSFNDSLSHLKVQIDDRILDARFIITREYNASSGIETEKLIFRPHTEGIRRGQYAEFKDRKWLIFFVGYDELCPKAHIKLCNKVLKFENGNQYPCVVENNIRNYQRIADLESINLITGTMKLMVQSNEDTWQIKETDRFIIDDLAWEVQGVDKVVYTNNREGVVELAIKQVPLSELEKEEIANENTQPIPESDYHLEIIGKDKVEINKVSQYETNLYKDGVLVDKLDYITTWSVDKGSISSDGMLFAPSNVTKIEIKSVYSYFDNSGNSQEKIASKIVEIYDNNNWGW